MIFTRTTSRPAIGRRSLGGSASYGDSQHTPVQSPLHAACAARATPEASTSSGNSQDSPVQSPAQAADVEFGTPLRDTPDGRCSPATSATSGTSGGRDQSPVQSPGQAADVEGTTAVRASQPGPRVEARLKELVAAAKPACLLAWHLLASHCEHHPRPIAWLTHGAPQPAPPASYQGWTQLGPCVHAEDLPLDPPVWTCGAGQAALGQASCSGWQVGRFTGPVQLLQTACKCPVAAWQLAQALSPVWGRRA